MSIRTSLKTYASVTFLLFAITAILAACGSSGSTTSSTSTSSSSGSTTTQTQPSAPRGGGFQPVSGTIGSYDASAKTLTVKLSDGSTQTFDASSARIMKSQKITQDQLSTALGTSGTIVMVMGQQGSDGTYTAQSLVVSDAANSGAAGGNGPRGGAPNGTPGARPGGTPGAYPGAGAGAGGRVVLSNAKLQNNQLVGTDQGGKSVTVNLSSSTTFMQQTTGSASDLTAGQTVTVAGGPAQSSGTATARTITVGDVAPQA
jgi:hypothetical protein